MEKILFSVPIQAPVSEVYEVISTLGGLRSWLTRDTTGDPEKGGELRLGFGTEHHTLMQVADARKNRLLSWTLLGTSFPGGAGGIRTKVSFALAETAGRGTVVTLKHDGWSEVTEFYRVCGYQWEKSLESLKQVCETGKGEPLTPAMLTSRKATGWFPVV